jgi:hypothetical protein
MNDENLNTIKEFKLNLKESGRDEILSKMISEIKNLGFTEIKVKIEGDVRDLLEKTGYSIDVFNRIKSTQDLPDWVVYDLIDSSGKLNKLSINE